MRASLRNFKLKMHVTLEWQEVTLKLFFFNSTLLQISQIERSRFANKLYCLSPACQRGNQASKVIALQTLRGDFKFVVNCKQGDQDSASDHLLSTAKSKASILRLLLQIKSFMQRLANHHDLGSSYHLMNLVQVHSPPSYDRSLLQTIRFSSLWTWTICRVRAGTCVRIRIRTRIRYIPLSLLATEATS